MRMQGFAREVIVLTKHVKPTPAMIEIIKQLVRAAGSVGANYIEANEAVSQKDFLLHARIARKEAKEARHWLGLLDVGDAYASEQQRLSDEATQLLKILSAIIKKSEDKIA